MILILGFRCYAGKMLKYWRRSISIRRTKSCCVLSSWQSYGYGAERSGRREANYLLVDALQGKYRSLPFDDAAAREYAVIRATLAQQGNPIGPNDTMIAAIARSYGVTLVTNNVGEFRRVSGLAIEDWQSA